MSSTPGAKMGDAFIAVTVDAAAVGPELEAQVDTALAQVVETADAAMTTVAAGAEEAAAKVGAAFDGASKAQQDAFLKSSAAAETASARVVAAQVAQVEAIAKVAEAQKALDDARASGTAEQVATAEASLATAMGKSEVAAAKVTAAVATETKAKADLTGATEALGGAEEVAAGKSIAAAEGISTKWMGMSALVGGVAVAGLAKTAGDYQQTLTKLATTAGESTGNLKMVGDGMLAMAGDVGVSAQHLSEGMYTVESAGIHGADALTVLKAAAQGAKQENADLEKVTDAVTTSLHDYHLPASDAAAVTSQLIDAVAHGKTTFDALTGSLHSVTPLASVLHVSLADVTGVLSSMTASGMSADQATQNMADTLRHLANPTNTMTQELASLGISSSDLADKLGKKGLSGTLQDVETAIVAHLDPATQRVLLPALNQSKAAAADMQQMIGQMPASMAKMSQGLLDGSVNITEYTKAAKGLGGTAGPMATQFLGLYKSQDGFNSVLKAGGPAAQSFEAAMAKSFGTASAMNVALQTTGENAAATNKAVKDIAAAVPQADGSIKGWSEVQGNFNQKLSETGASLQSWAIRMGQDLLPAATKIVSVVQSIVEWLGKHKTIAEGLIVAILGIATAWAAIKIGQGIKGMADDFTSAAKAIGEATTKMYAYAFATAEGETASRAVAAAQKIAAAATWLFNAALDGNPVVLITLAVIALIAVVVLVVTHFREVSTVAQEVGQWFAWLGGVIWGALSTAFDWIKTHWVLILEILAGPIGWAVALFTNFGPQILGALEGAGRALLGWVGDVAGWIGSLPGKAWDALVTFGPKVAAAIGTGLVAALKAVADFVAAVLVFFVTLPIKIAIVLFVLGEKIGEAFIAAFDYLKTNLPIWIDAAVQFFKDLPGKIWDAVWTIEGKLHDAFWNAIDAVGRNVSTWFAATLQFFKDLPGKIWDAIVTIDQKLHDAFWNAIDAVGRNVSTWFAATLQFFRDLPGKIWDGVWTVEGKLHDAFWNAFDKAKQVVSQGVTDIVNFVKGLPRDIANLAGDMLSAGSKLISSFLSGLAHVGSEVADIGRSVANAVIGFINTHVIDSIDSALNFSVMGVNIHAGVIPRIPMLADGGVIDRPTLAIVGEAGPEAVVPLTRPGRAAAVMGQAGLLPGGSDSTPATTGGRGVTLNVTNNLAVARQATAEQTAAIVADKLMRALRVGGNGSLVGLGVGA